MPLAHDTLVVTNIEDNSIISVILMVNFALHSTVSIWKIDVSVRLSRATSELAKEIVVYANVHLNVSAINEPNNPALFTSEEDEPVAAVA